MIQSIKIKFCDTHSRNNANRYMLYNEHRCNTLISFLTLLDDNRDIETGDNGVLFWGYTPVEKSDELHIKSFLYTNKSSVRFQSVLDVEVRERKERKESFPWNILK